MALVTIQPLLVILKIKTVKDIGWYNDKNPPEDGSTANSWNIVYVKYTTNNVQFLI